MFNDRLIFEPPSESKPGFHLCRTELLGDFRSRIEQALKGQSNPRVGCGLHHHVPALRANIRGSRIVDEEGAGSREGPRIHGKDVIVGIDVSRSKRDTSLRACHDRIGDGTSKSIDARKQDSLLIILDAQRALGRSECHIDMTLCRDREHDLLFVRIL